MANIYGRVCLGKHYLNEFVTATVGASQFLAGWCKLEGRKANCLESVPRPLPLEDLSEPLAVLAACALGHLEVQARRQGQRTEGLHRQLDREAAIRPCKILRCALSRRYEAKVL